MLRNGLSRRIGDSSSPCMSRTRKFVGIYLSCILTMTFLTMPSGNLSDWSAICNWIYLGYKGKLSNKSSYTFLDIMLQLDPVSQMVSVKVMSLIVHSMIGTRGSHLFVGNGWVAYDHFLYWQHWLVEQFLQVLAGVCSSSIFYCSSFWVLLVLIALLVWKDQDAQEGGELGFSKNLSNL